MKTEHQKMLAGQLYDPMDPELVAGRAHARDLCQALNGGRASEQATALPRKQRRWKMEDRK